MERYANTFGQHYLNGAGVRPQTPEDAPPLAGFNMKSLVAYYSIILYFHLAKKSIPCTCINKD
jgi:hypothetical protein